MTRTTRLLLPLAIVAGALAIFAYLAATRPQLARDRPDEKVWTVAVAEVRFGDVRPELRLYGEVVAGREADLRSLVAGTVVQIGAGLVEGGVVRRGDLLLITDAFDYRAALDERTAQLAEARAKLDEFAARHEGERVTLALNRDQLALRDRDAERARTLRARGTVSDKFFDNAEMAALQQRQLVAAGSQRVAAEAARVAQQRAAIERLEVALRRARRDLANTRLGAPFDGFVFDVTAAEGKRFGVNDRVARLVDADHLEASVSLSDAQYGRIFAAEGTLIGRPLRVRWRVGGETLAYDAVVARAGARIAAQSGGVEVFASLMTDGLSTPLRPGAFIEVSFPDRVYHNVARLPESALNGETVYVVASDRLEARRVTIAAHEGGAVIVSGDLAAGERVVTTRFPEIAPGLKVEVR